LAAPAESADQWPQRIDGVRFVRQLRQLWRKGPATVRTGRSGLCDRFYRPRLARSPRRPRYSRRMLWRAWPGQAAVGSGQIEGSRG
jgi:hypothetical protein